MDNKKKLLSSIKGLNLPLTEEEAKRNVDNLSEREIELLLIKSEVVRKHLSEINKEAKRANPKAHRDLKKKLDKELVEIEENYLSDMEKIQKVHDERMDKVEEEAKRKLEKIVGEHKSDVESISMLHNEIYQKINDVILAGKAS